MPSTANQAQTIWLRAILLYQPKVALSLPFLCLGLVNKLSSIFGWLRLRLAVSAQHQKSTSLCVPFLVLGFLASLVLAGAKTKPNFFTSP